MREKPFEATAGGKEGEGETVALTREENVHFPRIRLWIEDFLTESFPVSKCCVQVS